jgi:heparin binding hemagglutinin HbhA
MSTEDDLKRLGQAAAALAGVAAGRAKQVAEQLLAPHDKGREEAKHRAGSFVEEGRHAAADVVSALRREAAVILRDLEHLEQALRSRQGGAPATTTAKTALDAGEQAPARRAAAPKKSGPAAKAGPRKAPGETTAKKTTAQAKSAGPRKSTGGSRPSSTEGQG